MLIACHANTIEEVEEKKFYTSQDSESKWQQRFSSSLISLCLLLSTTEAMPDRFFPNPMPEFVPEQELQEAVTVTPSDSLQNLLAMPHSPLSNRLKRASLDLKETVLYSSSLSLHYFTHVSHITHQVFVFLCQIVVETWGLSGQRVGDFTLYCGLLGIAFLLFKSHQVTDNTNDFTLYVHIIKSCDAASVRSIGSPSQFTILLACYVSLCGGSILKFHTFNYWLAGTSPLFVGVMVFVPLGLWLRNISVMMSP